MHFYQNFYDIELQTIDGSSLTLENYKGKVLLIVNVASKCGLTPQYKGLQNLYDKNKSQGLEILAFPCNQFGNQEPERESTIQKFCQSNYQITFPLFAKIDVNGKNTHPLYDYLKKTLPGFMGSQNIKWNFTKFLVNRSGIPIKRFSPMTSPYSLEPEIIRCLGDV